MHFKNVFSVHIKMSSVHFFEPFYLVALWVCYFLTNAHDRKKKPRAWRLKVSEKKRQIGPENGFKYSLNFHFHFFFCSIEWLSSIHGIVILAMATFFFLFCLSNNWPRSSERHFECVVHSLNLLSFFPGNLYLCVWFYILLLFC